MEEGAAETLAPGGDVIKIMPQRGVDGVGDGTGAEREKEAWVPGGVEAACTKRGFEALFGWQGGVDDGGANF